MRKMAASIAAAAIIVTACSSAVGARLASDGSTDRAEGSRAAAVLSAGGTDASYDSVERSRSGAFQAGAPKSGGSHPHGRPHLGGTGTDLRGK